MKKSEGLPQFIPPPETVKSEMPDGEITPEQRGILESAVKFAEYLTGRWPQIDTGQKPIGEIDEKGTTVELPELPEGVETEPRLNYYLTGSLASMLLSRAERFSEMDETQIPALVESHTREIPESARKILATFARPIGDLDYVPTDFYNRKKRRVQNSYGKVSNEEYRRLRSRYLWKGGGGPSFDEVPEDGRQVLKKGEGQIKLMCDPVESYGARPVAKISVGGKDYYIARPDTMVAYKVLHLLQSYEQKPEKFNTDLGQLLGALKEMYSEQELVQITQQVLTGYEDTMERLNIRLNEGAENPTAYEKKIPKFIERVLANQQISPEIRAMLKKLITGKINSPI